MVNEILTVSLYKTLSIAFLQNLAFRRTNRTEQCIEMLRRCVSLDPDYAPAFVILARIASGPATGELLRHVIHLRPRNPDALAEYAYWLYENGESLNEISSEQQMEDLKSPLSKREREREREVEAVLSVVESRTSPLLLSTIRGSHAALSLYSWQNFALVFFRQMAPLAPVLLQCDGDLSVA